MKTIVYIIIIIIVIIICVNNRDFSTWRKNRSCSWRSKPNNRTR